MLIQPFVQYPGTRYLSAGEAWRQVRNRLIIPYGGALLLITVLAIGLFYKAKGSIPMDAPATGRTIERFTYFERAAHWSNALAFVLLAVSGLVMMFGKALLLPILGGTLFGWLAYALKNIHNFAGPLFAISLLVMIFTFVRDNLPSRDDINWLLKGGGLFSGKHVPSNRFNAGEKLIFWAGVFGLGLIVVASGLVLDKLVPGMQYLRPDMQVAHMIHATAAVLMMAMFLGHIYMGTLGMDGALDAMKTGQVDEAWAKQHHELWYDDIKAGKIPAQRSATPPAGLATGRDRMKKLHLCTIALAGALGGGLLSSAHAKLPPLSPEAKLKAEEAKHKSAWSDKVAAYQLCKAQDRAVASYMQDRQGRRQGREA